jgi:hypothetical protein
MDSSECRKIPGSLLIEGQAGRVVEVQLLLPWQRCMFPNDRLDDVTENNKFDPF